MAMTHWIAADWGTTRLRLWAMDTSGEVVGTATSDDGMGQLTPDAFEPAFLKTAAPFLSADRCLPVIICGMAGARTGWKEAGYGAVPAPPSGQPEVVKTVDQRIDVHILPGLSQSEPPDVMRGEETQIAGLIHQTPNFDGMLCLPGTHTKWATIANGQVRRFRTAMTGELFALLSSQSTLAGFTSDGWDEPAFKAAVAQNRDAPLAADLFSLRARGLLHGFSDGEGRARLSGLLIGAEVSAMVRGNADAHVTLLGDPTLCRIYEIALEHLGLGSQTLDAQALTLAGLTAAYNRHIAKT